MMKINKLLPIVIICLFSACQKDQTLLFNESPGIYFSNNNTNNKRTITGFNGQKNELYYDFTLGTSVETDEYGYETIKYLGDSLVNDTIKIEVYRLGKLTQNNEFNLKLISTNDDDEDDNDENKETLEAFSVEFFNPYSFDEGEAKVSAKVVFHRPASQGKYKTIIGFDLANSGSFTTTIDESDKYTVIANNQYRRPNGWIDKNSIYGAFSEEKYAFYITVLGKVYQNWHEYMGYDYLPKLRKALAEYNATHQIPKNFSF